ncbi:N-acetyltransferase ESCO2-like isoform X2 [Phymastichus coffea]|uniref:N-acetyltransferase ESCO2-like isoform X2 n=1 Tax=Phymastichus coffea TaxID=108790 RepID=UPI00273ABD2D|nr:N-acetyltransferase ESCO2-like isoform X2 [Phymastichus coffea]
MEQKTPNILGTINKKIDESKSSLLYDFPNKRITRKRKVGGINSGVGHGIKKLKCKVNYIKNESLEMDENTVTAKQCETLLKENVGELENCHSVEDYNPNKKFFKHKRPAVLQITVGKLKHDKNMKQEKIVKYSNVFGSLNSKMQFHKQLNIGQHAYSNLEARNNFSHSSTIVNKAYFDKYKHQENPQKLLPTMENLINSRHFKLSNDRETRAENKVDEGIDQEFILYQNLAMDIKNNNFSNNEMMTDVVIYNHKDLTNQLAVGNNLFFIDSWITDDSSKKNNLEEKNLHDSGKLRYSSTSQQYEKDVKHSNVRKIQCQKCKFVDELGNKNEEMAHSNNHNNFCDVQLEEWIKEHSVEISTGTDSIIIIKPYDPKTYKDKVFDLLRFIKTEASLCDYDLMDNQKKNFFMYVREKLIIGILVAEPLDYAFRFESNSSAPFRVFSETFSVKCGINLIWVSKNHRKQGIATKMVDCLRNCFFNNYRMDVSDLAFSIPTTSGRYFIEKYVKSCDFNVF